MRWIVFLLVLFTPYLSLCETELEGIVEKTIHLRRISQKKMDEWSKEREKIIASCKLLMERKKMLMDELEGLTASIEDEERKIKELEKSIEESKKIKNNLEEYLYSATFSLEKRIKSDLPFYREERLARLEKLRKKILDPSIPLPSKYKEFMEILKKEVGYGYSVEVYRDTVEVNGKRYFAEILRLGRIALYFRTPDREKIGWFVPSKGVWEELPRKYKRALDLAYDMAEKRRSTEFIKLPIGRISP